MKKLSLTLAILMLALVLALAVPASAATANGSYGDVPFYKGGITIDGKIDEAYTKLGLKIDCTLDFDDAGYKSDAEAWIYVLHDGEFLYVVADVYDPYDIDVNNYLESEANSGLSWRASGLELYIDWTNGGAGSDLYEDAIAEGAETAKVFIIDPASTMSPLANCITL